jgi:hypothetical protein
MWRGPVAHRAWPLPGNNGRLFRAHRQAWVGREEPLPTFPADGDGSF